jgi:hypothetical protein
VTLLGALVPMALVVLLNVSLNFYGVFGNAKGLKRAPQTNEMFAKYLYGFNYIPANYDALIVGNSTSECFYPSEIHDYRTYNLATGASTMTQLRQLADNALDHGQFKLVLFGVHPQLVRSRAAPWGNLSPREWWISLGSRRLLGDYIAAAWQRFRHKRPEFEPDGRADFQEHHAVKKVDADEMLRHLQTDLANEVPGQVIDDGAVADLEDFVKSLRARGVRVAVFFPPFYNSTLVTFRDKYERFNARVRPLFKPEEIIVDFNDGTHLDLTADKTHFLDGLHLNNQWARVASKTLDAALHAPTAAKGTP